MKFCYTIIYVEDVKAATVFYNEAFSIETKFIHESGDYAELETGETTLAFAAFSLGESNFPSGFTKLTDMEPPVGIEIALVTDDVESAVVNSIAAGATPISGPVTKPWGQTVAYVRAPDGTLIELCTPVGGNSS